MCVSLFFFQAEDGIRDGHVTGVQTCALPICRMLETFLAFQKTWKDSATAQLQAANIPTRDDIARLGELILGLEEKVDQLVDRVGAGDRRPPPPPRRRPRAEPKKSTPR